MDTVLPPLPLALPHTTLTILLNCLIYRYNVKSIVLTHCGLISKIVLLQVHLTNKVAASIYIFLKGKHQGAPWTLVIHQKFSQALDELNPWEKSWNEVAASIVSMLLQDRLYNTFCKKESTSWKYYYLAKVKENIKYKSMTWIVSHNTVTTEE